MVSLQLLILSLRRATWLQVVSDFPNLAPSVLQVFVEIFSVCMNFLMSCPISKINIVYFFRDVCVERSDIRARLEKCVTLAKSETILLTLHNACTVFHLP